MPGLRLAGLGALPRRDQSNRQALTESFVDNRAHDNPGMFAMVLDLFDDTIDFSHGQIRSAHEADQDSFRLVEDPTSIEHGVRQQLVHDFTGTGWAHGFSDGEGTFGMAIANQLTKIAEMDFNQTGVRQEPPDTTDRVGEEIARYFERLENAGVLVNEFENSLIGQANHPIGGAFD